MHTVISVLDIVRDFQYNILRVSFESSYVVIHQANQILFKHHKSNWIL